MNSDLLTLLLGISIVVMVCKKDSIIEHFGTLPPRAVRAEQIAQHTCGPQKGQFYTLPGTYQAMVNPRQAGMVDYGAGLRYKMPDDKYMAQSMGSLAPQPAVVKEMYEQPNGEVFSKPPPSNFSAGNYGTKLSQLSTGASTSIVPKPVSGGSAMATMNELGQVDNQCNPIIFERLIYANQRAPSLVGADPIRGDLPILPRDDKWFSVSANPQTMLKDGALAAMGGLDNNNTKELMALKSAASGGFLDTGSGVNYTVQKSMYGSSAGSGLKVTAFP